LARNMNFVLRLIEQEKMSWRDRNMHLSKNSTRENHLRRRLKVRTERDFQPFRVCETRPGRFLKNVRHSIRNYKCSKAC